MLACTSKEHQGIVSTNTQMATAVSPTSTPTILPPSETPTITATLDARVCIPNSASQPNYYQVKLNPKDYGIQMKVVGNPVSSPDNQYLAAALYEGNGTQGISHFIILNLEQSKVTWLGVYRALDWQRMDIVWSPNSQWVVFFPDNRAYGEDGGLWIFDITGINKYHHRRATSIETWDQDSQNIYFGFKDGYAGMKVLTWEVTRAKKCP